MQDNSFTVWSFNKGRSNDKRIIQKLGAKPGENGTGAADPAAISFFQHQPTFEDVVRALKKGIKPMVDGLEGRKSLEIILAIYRAALSGGKPVHLPLKRTPVRKPFRD
jgi:UDP-N-acetyl-2-amino-2-deoxyglucuronate dehydrogenase